MRAGHGVRRGDLHAVLAAVYAENGRFEEAVRWQEQALHDPRCHDDSDLRARLNLYRSRTPYRQTVPVRAA